MEGQEQCYPCSIYGHSCVVLEEWEPVTQQRRRVQVPVLPYSNVDVNCSWFDVVLSVRSLDGSFPEYISTVEAVGPFAAIEQLMRFHRLRSVAYASARPLDQTGGLIVYRAFQVHICL